MVMGLHQRLGAAAGMRVLNDDLVTSKPKPDALNPDPLTSTLTSNNVSIEAIPHNENDRTIGSYQ